jgi:hypothetical protein
MRSDHPVAVAIVAIVVSSGCIAKLSIPAEAQLECASNSDCPASSLCSSEGLCVQGGPCLVQGTAEAVADGTACGDGVICFAGECVSPFCGDGIVELSRGEECDPKADSTCRANCTLPRCGDGIVDASSGETCDDASATCVDCTFMCLGADNGGPNGDCDLDPKDGCECSPFSFPLSAITATHIVIQAAVRGDRVYLVFADIVGGRPQFTLDSASVSAELATTPIASNVAFLDLADPENPNDEELFYSRTLTGGGGELDRIDATGNDSVLYTMTSSTVFGRIAIDDDAVWGAGEAGLVRVSRADGGVSNIATTACHDGKTPALVSCGAVVGCVDTSGDFHQIDKTTHDEKKIFHVDLIAGPQNTVANQPVLFCRDGALHYEDRVAVWKLDGNGARTPIAVLPKLVQDSGLVGARALGDDVLVAGVVPVTQAGVTVFVDAAHGNGTVLFPAAYLAHHAHRVVGLAATTTASFMVLDLTRSP